MEVFDVFCLQQGGDQDVIEVPEDVRDVSKDGIHHVLEVLACVLESKWHEQELEETEGCDDCGLVDVLRRHWDLMVTLVEVDLGKDCLARHVGDVTDGVAVIFGDQVEMPVFSA